MDGVTEDGPDHAIWAFTGPVSTDGSACPQLVIETDEGPQGAASVEQVSFNTIRCYYGDGGVAPAQPWTLTGVPEGLNLYGATIEWPQSGSVLA